MRGRAYMRNSNVYAGTKCYGQGGVSVWDSTVISRGILRILLELLLVSTQFVIGFTIVACKQILLVTVPVSHRRTVFK